MIQIRKIALILSVFILCSTLCACNASNGDTYTHLLGEEAAQSAIDLANGTTISGSVNFRTWVSNVTLSIAVGLRSVCVIVCFVSVLVGIIGLFLFKKTMWIRKYCIFGAIIGIPVLMIVLTYGSAFLASWFL